MEDANTSNAKRKNDDLEENAEIEKQPKYRVTTTNRYELLSEYEGDSESDEQATTTEATRTRRAPTPKKESPPAPITLHDRHEHRPLTTLINKTITNAYNIKYTRDGTIIFTSTKQDRLALLDEFQRNKFNFHTYTDKDIRTAQYVIRGLSKQTTTDMIMKELEEKHGIKVIRCAEMRTKTQPLYLITLNKDHEINKLRTVTGLDHTKIYWEHYTTQRRITQCHRCQMWGHATSNCYAAPKCLKCAKSHLTSECTKTTDTPAKCVNCGGDHPASAIICPMFIRRRKWLDERAEARRPHRTAPPVAPTPRAAPPRSFAPAPAQNPWAMPGATRAPPTIHTDTRPTNATNATLDDFNELQSEIKKMNELINVREVLRKIKNLNARLAAATTQHERTQIAVLFFSGLDD